MEKIIESLGAILREAVKQPFRIELTVAPLKDVEKLWNAEEDARLVFQP